MIILNGDYEKLIIPVLLFKYSKNELFQNQKVCSLSFCLCRIYRVLIKNLILAFFYDKLIILIIVLLFYSDNKT